ncbi:MAG: VOC family protein [Hyphomonadaceae bacterium]
MGYLRLRQICLVARDLAPVEAKLTAILGTEVCYRDPGVGKYGLHNALWALDGTFLEVVAPKDPKSDTAAGRYLDRRKGDGGYMYILDCDDLDARREHFKAMDVRMVQDLHSGDETLWSEAIHLHPRDTGGCLLSIDRHSGGENTMGGYKWAGPSWQEKVNPDIVITGATMQCDDPEAVAERWGLILRRPVLDAGDNVRVMNVDNAEARFTPLADDRGEGETEVYLRCADAGAVLAAAEREKARTGEINGKPFFEACGVRFLLV